VTTAARLALLAATVGATGCAQILGLDSTDRRDAGGGGACAQDLQCDMNADRAVCGRLVDAVTQAPFAATAATGALCVAGTATEGPCTFVIVGESADDLFAGTGNPITATTLDDCGRFRVEGLTGAALAIVAEPITPADAVYRRVAATVLYNGAGPIDGLEVPVVTQAVVTGWESMTAGATLPDGILALFRIGGAPSEGVVAKIDTIEVGVYPAMPFALYFDGASPFETITETDGDGPRLRTATGPTGTAVLVPKDDNPFILGGDRPGKNCTELDGIRRVANTLVYIELTNC